MPKPNHVFDAVPQVLRDTPRWLLWKSVPNPNGGKPRKVPVQANGINAQVNQPSTWSSYEAVAKAFDPKKHAGIGFVFDGSDGLTGIDLDNCLDDCGLPNDVAQAFIDLPGYQEYSPSGNGIHIITRTEYVNSPGTHHAIGLEIYTTSRYFTFTGDYIQGDVPTTPIRFDGLIEKYLSKDAVTMATTVPDFNAFANWKAVIADYPLERVQSEILSKLDPNMGEPDWFKVGAMLHHQGQGEQEWLDAFDEWSSTADNYTGYASCAERWQRYNISRFKGQVTTLRSYLGKPEAPVFDPVQALEGWFNSKDLAARRGPPKWVIKGMLQEDARLLIWGKSMSFKSFIAIELAVCLASGKDFFGYQVKQTGPVVYVAGEGAGGLQRRFDACCKKHNLRLEDLPLYFNSGTKDLKNPVIVKDTKVLADLAFEEHGQFPVMYFFDTYNTSSSADENSASDFAIINQNLGEIMKYQKCSVAIIHHPGKDGKTFRGSSALHNGMDTEFMVERQEGTQLSTITNKKQKDQELINPFAVLAEFVVLGEDDDGMFGSLVLNHTDAPVKPKEPSKSLESVWAALLELHSTINGPVPVQKWRDMCFANGFVGSGTEGTKRSNWSRKLSALINEKFVKVENDLASPIGYSNTNESEDDDE